MSTARQFGIFFAIAFGFSWLVEACMIVLHLRIEFTILATMGPTIGAVVAQRLATGSYRPCRINVSWPRTLAAASLGVALVVVSFVMAPSLEGVLKSV